MNGITHRLRARLAIRVALVSLLGIVSESAHACSSCGCTLSSDWGSQGYSSEQGFRVDLRFDYFNQDQLRSGTATVDRGSLGTPNEREIQQLTINRNTTLAFDYSPSADWGFNLAIPYFDRYHTTIAPGDTEISTSHTRSVGDVRLLARYSGFSPQRGTGIQLGVKLATGSFHNDFIDGPQAGSPLDRGLQPGTGTTDLLLGIYNFGAINPDWEYFAQALVQQPVASREDFRPGTGLNANFGVRYAALENVFPQIQVNVRSEKRESGANADVANSGSTLVYFSPGIMVKLAQNLVGYAFAQVPIYQRVNGLQIEPRYSVSLGLHYSM